VTVRECGPITLFVKNTFVGTNNVEWVDEFSDSLALQGNTIRVVYRVVRAGFWKG